MQETVLEEGRKEGAMPETGARVFVRHRPRAIPDTCFSIPIATKSGEFLASPDVQAKMLMVQ
jgi:hypothetical protein